MDFHLYIGLTSSCLHVLRRIAGKLSGSAAAVTDSSLIAFMRSFSPNKNFYINILQKCVFCIAMFISCIKCILAICMALTHWLIPLIPSQLAIKSVNFWKSAFWTDNLPAMHTQS